MPRPPTNYQKLAYLVDRINTLVGVQVVLVVLLQDLRVPFAIHSECSEKLLVRQLNCVVEPEVLRGEIRQAEHEIPETDELFSHVDRLGHDTASPVKTEEPGSHARDVQREAVCAVLAEHDLDDILDELRPCLLGFWCVAQERNNAFRAGAGGQSNFKAVAGTIVVALDLDGHEHPRPGTSCDIGVRVLDITVVCLLR